MVNLKLKLEILNSFHEKSFDIQNNSLLENLGIIIEKTSQFFLLAVHDKFGHTESSAKLRKL